MKKLSKRTFPSSRYALFYFNKFPKQYYEWIENTINKEVLSKIIKDKKPLANSAKKKEENGGAGTATATSAEGQKKTAAKEQLLKMQN